MQLLKSYPQFRVGGPTILWRMSAEVTGFAGMRTGSLTTLFLSPALSLSLSSAAIAAASLHHNHTDAASQSQPNKARPFPEFRQWWTVSLFCQPHITTVFFQILPVRLPFSWTDEKGKDWPGSAMEPQSCSCRGPL